MQRCEMATGSGCNKVCTSSHKKEGDSGRAAPIESPSRGSRSRRLHSGKIDFTT